MVNVVNLLLNSPVKAPTGLWAIILNWIESGIVNYGWVIIVFTLLIKVCLSPLDFLIKFSTKKSTLVQQKLAPQIARINKKYQNDRNQAQLQTNALYKREGFNVFGSCIIKLINLALTMTVFLTLFASLREMSAYKAINQYNALETAYTQAYNAKIEDVKADFKTKFNTYSTIIDSEGNSTETSYATYQATFEAEDGIFNNFYILGNSLTESQTAFVQNTKLTKDSNEITILDLLQDSGKIASDAGNDAANETWKDVKENWLWVENIWVSDNYKSPLPTYNDLKEIAKSSKTKAYINYVNEIDKDLYNTVTGSVQTKINRWNGYFILAVLAAVTSFLSQYVTERMSKSKNKQVNKLVEQSNPTGGAMKFMKFLLPAMMVIFVITSSTAFGIYIVWSSIVSMGISSLISLIVNACFKKKEQEVMESLEKEVVRSMKKLKKNK